MDMFNGKIKFDLTYRSRRCFWLLCLIVLVHQAGAQQSGTSPHAGDTVSHIISISGRITDAGSKLPVPYATVATKGAASGVQSNVNGSYSLKIPGGATAIIISSVGYESVTKELKDLKSAVLNIALKPESNLINEVAVHAGKRKKYRNKGNPAVELIQQVIDHKDSNRMLYADYMQFNQYERVNFSLFDLSEKFLKSRNFQKYRFMLDTGMVINDSVRTVLPLYMSEKYFDVYDRKNPSKLIKILKGHREVNFSAYIDSAGLDIYLNRLYGSPDIYENNIFVLTNQFLSPIADHARDYYKFFITDTIGTGAARLVEISFTPRNLGDLLFEGKLLVTLDGRYAVKSVEMRINRHININFVRKMVIRQQFMQHPDGRYYLTKTEVQADFGLMKEKGVKVFGDRVLYFSDYLADHAMSPDFYAGNSDRTVLDNGQSGEHYWLQHRGDTLRPAQAQLYKHMDSLEHMPSFKRTMWLASFLTGGYADFGILQLGPNTNFYAFNTLEGSRIFMGGRTTPEFNKQFYIEGYTAYGTQDQKEKYYAAGIWSFNSVNPWKFPNNYFRMSYQYDVDIPGQNFLIDKQQSILASFTRGTNNLWQYNRIFNVDYNRDLLNHFSFDIGFRHWGERQADQLLFENGNGEIEPHIATTEFNVNLRFAPHEQIFQGTDSRHNIPNKYPIFSVRADYGIKGAWAGNYNYLNLSGNIYKRFYLSQLGFTDVTLLGGVVSGSVPFPYLAIMPASQNYLYNKNAYNDMNFLEFVADHYIGLDVTHAFGGFLLNKVPLIDRLKLREYFSFKILYGGIRQENNPLLHPELFRFPVNGNGTQLTYPLGNQPYIETGFGIGNIFKIIRTDLVWRLEYLDHPNVAPLGLRISVDPDL